MSGPLFADLNAYALVALAAFWLALWFGMYVASRRPRSKAALLTGLAFVCGAIYLLKVAYFYVPTTVEGVTLREKWLGGWVAFTPALLLHAFMMLTGIGRRRRAWVLVPTYILALVVFAWGFSEGAFNDFSAVTLDGERYLQDLPPGRFYWLVVVQMVVTLLMSLVVLVRARFTRPVPPRVACRQLDLLIVGVTLLTAGVGQILINGLLTAPVPDAVLFPIGVVGTAMLGVPLVRYSAGLGGELLRSDLGSSLLAALMVLISYLVVAAVVDASVDTVAGTAWLVLVPAALGSELRTITDRVFYGHAGRAARVGLRTAEAYAGTSKKVDLDALKPGQSGGVIGYLSDLHRASLVSTGRGFVDEDWLKLLAREEFAPVRRALDIQENWTPEDRLPWIEIQQHVTAKLLPRERQALGLWYMGHSDKDMARLMGIKPNVPRSYLNEGKKKLGLPAGPPLMLFVHFSGFVGLDALPLLEDGAADRSTH